MCASTLYRMTLTIHRYCDPSTPGKEAVTMEGVTEELIVLVDDEGRSIGSMPKPLVHHGETPLHRAFSVYLFDDRGRLLVTRRALGQQTFPGMWTNTVCGHPGPGEDDADAIARRARFELGLAVADIRP